MPVTLRIGSKLLGIALFLEELLLLHITNGSTQYHIYFRSKICGYESIKLENRRIKKTNLTERANNIIKNRKARFVSDYVTETNTNTCII